MEELKKEDIDRLMRDHLNKCLDEMEEIRAMAKIPWSDKKVDDQLDVLSFQESDARRELALNNYGNVRKQVDNLTEEQGIANIDKDSFVISTDPHK